jgi:hypothetical protein
VTRKKLVTTIRNLSSTYMFPGAQETNRNK